MASDRLRSRKQWMAGQMKITGTITIDDGAAKVLRSAGKSLLPVGVLELSGSFKRGGLVRCVTSSGEEVARGLSNYHVEEAEKIIGKSSELIADILGYGGEDELIHRDNLVLL
jgi:glutamate 5-kinase